MYELLADSRTRGSNLPHISRSILATNPQGGQMTCFWCVCFNKYCKGPTPASQTSERWYNQQETGDETHTPEYFTLPPVKGGTHRDAQPQTLTSSIQKHLVIHSSAFSRAGHQAETGRGTISFHLLLRTATEKGRRAGRPRVGRALQAVCVAWRELRGRREAVPPAHSSSFYNAVPTSCPQRVPSRRLPIAHRRRALPGSRPRLRRPTSPRLCRTASRRDAQLLVPARPASAGCRLLTASGPKHPRVRTSVFKAQCISQNFLAKYT